MLTQLYIKNFALIDTLELELREGFSVITGETGAGKSIILGALGLLLGQRADSKTLKQGADKCVVEAHFDLRRYALEPFFRDNDIEYDAADTIVRRELTAAGKSRAFVNDTPAPLTLLKELGERLVDIHSQHQNLLLSTHDFQLNVLDVMADDEKQLAAYRAAYEQQHLTERRLAQLRDDIAQGRQQADFLQFQFDELSSARLTPGEQEELEQKSDTMTHAEDIKSALYESDRALQADTTGIVGQLRQATAALRSIARVLPAAGELSARMESAHIELKDIAQEVSTLLEDVDFDPSELDAVNARLDKLYDLEKKYHAETVDELIALREETGRKLSNIENSDEALHDLEQQLEAERAVCMQQADKLTTLRTRAARTVEQEMRRRLVPLNMPNVRFEVSLEPTALTANGHDKVAFRFSANSATPLQPVSQVASGGEIARVMLALKAMISRTVKLPTIIFDEIDTGVSGQTAEKMALIMREMGQAERQVLSITHLPQIAAMGTTHYKVYKEETPTGTVSRMRQLSDEERVTEIAQMLSGSNVSDAAIENARALLGSLYGCT